MNQSEIKVQTGETLISISVRENVNINLLRRMNSLYGNEIYSGQILVIPLKQESPKKNQNLTKVPETSTDGDDTVLKKDVKSNDNSFLTRVRALSIPPITLPLIFTERNTEKNTEKNAERNTEKNTERNAERKRQQEKEQFDKIPPVLLGEKKILCHEKASKLRRFLPTMQQFESWRLLYSVLNDGADFGSFFRRTKNHKYTLTIVETMNGELFGGFNSMEWITSLKFCEYNCQRLVKFFCMIYISLHI